MYFIAGLFIPAITRAIFCSNVSAAPDGGDTGDSEDTGCAIDWLRDLKEATAGLDTNPGTLLVE